MSLVIDEERLDVVGPGVSPARESEYLSVLLEEPGQGRGVFGLEVPLATDHVRNARDRQSDQLGGCQAAQTAGRRAYWAPLTPAQFINDVEDELGEDLFTAAWGNRTSSELIEFGRALLKKAEGYARANGIVEPILIESG